MLTETISNRTAHLVRTTGFRQLQAKIWHNTTSPHNVYMCICMYTVYVYTDRNSTARRRKPQSLQACSLCDKNTRSLTFFLSGDIAMIFKSHFLIFHNCVSGRYCYSCWLSCEYSCSVRHNRRVRRVYSFFSYVLLSSGFKFQQALLSTPPIMSFLQSVLILRIFYTRLILTSYVAKLSPHATGTSCAWRSCKARSHRKCVSLVKINYEQVHGCYLPNPPYRMSHGAVKI